MQRTIPPCACMLILIMIPRCMYYRTQGRVGRVEKADIQEYIEKAKTGKLSGLIKQHIFCDFVAIRYGDVVSLAF